MVFLKGVIPPVQQGETCAALRGGGSLDRAGSHQAVQPRGQPHQQVHLVEH